MSLVYPSSVPFLLTAHWPESRDPKLITKGFKCMRAEEELYEHYLTPGTVFGGR